MSWHGLSGRLWREHWRRVSGTQMLRFVFDAVTWVFSGTLLSCPQNVCCISLLLCHATTLRLPSGPCLRTLWSAMVVVCNPFPLSVSWTVCAWALASRVSASLPQLCLLQPSSCAVTCLTPNPSNETQNCQAELLLREGGFVWMSLQCYVVGGTGQERHGKSFAIWRTTLLHRRASRSLLRSNAFSR